jgi:ketol-acid reductoisomerase
MVEIFYDADLGALKGELITVIGYGNQGRAQALNLRDSGLEVIVGGVADESLSQAADDGFVTLPLAEAAEEADVVMLLVPDEVAPAIYHDSILPGLSTGKALEFASGYNITYGFIAPPAGVDVILVAPRMIGRAVRELYVQGKGAPALVGIQQDATGRAKARTLALAKAIGATRSGAVWSSFEEETLTDLFGEQFVGGLIHQTRLAFEVMREAGISDEAALLELVLSGEMVEVYKAIAEMGLWEQLRLHSHTSQYGQQTRGQRLAGHETAEALRSVMTEIKDGSFAREWELEQKTGMGHFGELWRENLDHPFSRSERTVKKRLSGHT